MKTIISILILLLFSSFFIYLLIQQPTEKEKRIELKNKGYNQTQTDSSIESVNDYFPWSVIM